MFLTLLLHRGVTSLVVASLLAAVVYGAMVGAIAADPACGSTITASTVLTGDLDCTGFTGTAITIGADGVTLDGGGFRIIAPNAATGIYLPGRSGTILTNLSIDAVMAVYVQAGGGNEIADVDVSWGGGSATGWGVYVNGSSNNTTTDLTATGRIHGIQLAGASSGNTIRSNTISGNQYGIYGLSNTGQGNLFLDNDLTDNSYGAWPSAPTRPSRTPT